MRDRLIELGRRVATLWRRRRFERDLDDELAFHLAMKEAEYARAGDEDPRHAAARRFGNAGQVREALRDMWTFPALESVWADVRLAVRRLVKDRSFALVAIAALALGIGANSTFFALVNAICLRGVPIDAPDRVMIVGSRDAANRPGGLSNGRPVTIVGVMPEGFRFPGTADLWLPLAAMPGLSTQPREARSLSVFGRLTDGVTRAQAEAELTTIRAVWTRDSLEDGRGLRTTVVPINEAYNPSVTQRQWLAFITVGVLVLLIACANVANLLLMRGVSRAREMAVRASIGGTRGRIVRQLLIEGVVLSASGSVLGLLVAHAGLRALTGMHPPDALPYWMTFSLDYRVVGALALTSLVSVLVFALAPALHLSKTDPAAAMNDGGRGGTRGIAARRWMASFLAAECALTLVLLAAVVEGARLGLAAARNELRVDGSNVLTMWLTLPQQAYPTVDARATFYARLDGRLAGLAPGADAALASALPAGGGVIQDVAIRGRILPAGEPAPTAVTIAVGDRYFDVAGIPLRGAGFGAANRRDDLETAIVNERFVRLFLPDREPIGAYVRVGSDPDSSWLSIVGVVPTVRQRGGLDPDPVVYRPVRAVAPATMAIVARGPGDSAALAGPLRQALVEMDPNLALYRVMTLERAMQEAQWNGRVSNVLLRSVASIGALLALVGVYAVTGYAVGQRRRELAVLGAPPRQLRWLVLRPTMLQLSGGLLLGVGCTYVFDRLFSVADQPAAMSDLATLVPLIAAVVIVATAACLVPALRAVRINPIEALRAE